MEYIQNVGKERAEEKGEGNGRFNPPSYGDYFSSLFPLFFKLCFKSYETGHVDFVLIISLLFSQPLLPENLPINSEFIPLWNIVF